MKLIREKITKLELRGWKKISISKLSTFRAYLQFLKIFWRFEMILWWRRRDSDESKIFRVIKLKIGGKEGSKCNPCHWPFHNIFFSSNEKTDKEGNSDTSYRFTFLHCHYPRFEVKKGNLYSLSHSHRYNLIREKPPHQRCCTQRHIHP